MSYNELVIKLTYLEYGIKWMSYRKQGLVYGVVGGGEVLDFIYLGVN